MGPVERVVRRLRVNVGALAVCNGACAVAVFEALRSMACIHCLPEYHFMIENIAILILNTIALIATLVARSEFSKALREIDKLSSSRDSLRNDASSSFALSHVSTFDRNSDPGTPYSCCASNLATATGPRFSSFASVEGDIETPNV